MKSRKHRYYSFDGEEDLNPMNFVSNLSDVMMILAVGIMLALVLHWNVPITTAEDTPQDGTDDIVEFTEDELEGADDLPENIQRAGEVYYDPDTGSYYIVYETP